jgi:hypothetical protein
VFERRHSSSCSTRGATGTLRSHVPRRPERPAGGQLSRNLGFVDSGVSPAGELDAGRGSRMPRSEVSEE